jgi:ATP-dependent helicase/DNAse subunit B
MPQLLYNTDTPEFTSLDFNEVVLDAARSGDLHRHLFIVPTQRRRREVERDITEEHYRQTRSPIAGLPIHTFGTFAHDLYRTIAPTRREISPAMQVALMERAMREVDLEYYGGGERGPSPGVVERITRVISGVRADGIMPSTFAQDLEFAEEHPDRAVDYDTVKLRDLYNIYSQYLRLLDDRWIDYPGTLLFVNNELFRDRDATFGNAFPATLRVLIHGFTELTQPEIAMILQLGLVTDLSVSIYFDYARENGPLYGNFDEVIDKLTTGGFRSIDLDPLQTDIPEEERRPFRHHMRRNLFRTDERIMNSAFDDMVSVYGFFSREEEVQGIAALVKSLVVDDGYKPEEICIATYDLARYAGTFREHLASHGVPAIVTAQFPIESSALVTALLSAFTILTSDYDRRDVIRAITSPYLNFGKEVDPAALTEAATRLRIVRGERSWSIRIERRVSYLRTRLMRLSDDDERRSIEQELQTLDRAEQSIRALSSTLDGFNHPMTPAEFRASFMQLIARLCVTENILQLRRDLESRQRTPQDWQRIHDEVERDTRALNEFIRLLDELTEFLEIEDRAHAQNESTADSEGKHPLDFYLNHLRVAATRSFYQLREKHDYGVLVTSLRQLPGLEFPVMIICGLVDGEFPSTYIPEHFLGKPLLDTQRRQLRRERIEFYGAITQFTERLVMSHPRFSGDTALVRSSFLDSFLRITTIEESGRALEVEELRVMRERIRRGEPMPQPLEFLSVIATPESFAEEGGAAIWSGQSVPRVDVDDALLNNLRHTAQVEMDRYVAKTQGNNEVARPYRGIITEALTPEELAHLAERRRIEYSTTQLELYARCPFKFFAQRILRVVSPISYDVTLTPLERGVLLHTVLFRLYTELKGHGELPITPDNRDLALARAREITNDEISGIVFDHPYWKIDQERLLGSDDFNGLLEEWIDADIERGQKDSRLEPMFFEVGFGKENIRGGNADSELTTREEVELRDMKLRGSVDRIEVFRQGEDIYYAVADYKTGQPPSRVDVRDGLSMQLMIYLEVVRHLLAERFEVPLENVKPAGGIYYQLRAQSVDVQPRTLFVPNELKKDILMKRQSKDDPDTTDDLLGIIDEAFDYAERYISGIADGVYHVTTHDVNRVCRGCEYQSVCRVAEVGIFE